MTKSYDFNIKIINLLQIKKDYKILIYCIGVFTLIVLWIASYPEFLNSYYHSFLFLFRIWLIELYLKNMSTLHGQSELLENNEK